MRYTIELRQQDRQPERYPVPDDDPTRYPYDIIWLGSPEEHVLTQGQRAAIPDLYIGSLLYNIDEWIACDPFGRSRRFSQTEDNLLAAGTNKLLDLALDRFAQGYCACCGRSGAYMDAVTNRSRYCACLRGQARQQNTRLWKCLSHDGPVYINTDDESYYRDVVRQTDRREYSTTWENRDHYLICESCRPAEMVRQTHGLMTEFREVDDPLR